ncbi:effector binding domain-containing protein [Ornithinibacillus massiliensis]|uniref:Effector binding domain-containing protein n=3 Tax=Ornithinibacillus TaxID=484508 RepID=A0ABS5MA60_9BACI|nr:effector binding domain-containing protein [Ornithinibacillus massiliensis]MBS3678827.1 effector binding domain-containing protein [Ornithinibacillus massiliensis]
MFHKNNQQFNVLGKKYTGKFEEYPIIIPKAIEDFRESYRGDDSFTRVIVYEPKKSPEHTVGYFYLGALVEGEPAGEVPEKMNLFQYEGEFASISVPLDLTKMGEYYDELINWIVKEGDQADPNYHLIEVYRPTNTGQEQLEIYMRINTVKE